MTPGDFHARAGHLFLELVALDASDRAVRLAEVAVDDPALARHVQALLARDAEPCEVLDRAAESEELQGPLLRAIEAAAALPETIGRYRVLGRLGRGGMGEVYLAEQEHPRRQVALKVVDTVIASPEALRRFAFEAQVLARLNHPGIARLHDAATATIAGRPHMHIAMEVVRGVPIDEFVRTKAASPGEVVALMARVCDAVQHAHAKGVVHRDLKPANVLVDDDGHPKILDFGVARLMNPDGSDETMHTRRGVVVGTLPFMAPEQVVGEPDVADTRADVYALGALLFLLLTGHPPIATDGMSLPDAARAISETSPAVLGSIDRRLKGDVEAIVAKALEKDPARRYQTAAELAADLRRHLEREPVLARLPSTAYLLARLTRKHRRAVIAVALVGIALVMGAVSWGRSIQQQLRAERAEQQAGVTMTDLKEFFGATLAVTRSATMTRQEIAVETALDVAGRWLDRGVFREHPETEAELRETIAKAYGKDRSFHARAEPHFRRTLELRLAADPDCRVFATANTMKMLADNQLDQGKHVAAEELYLKTIAKLPGLPNVAGGTEVLLLELLSGARAGQGRFDQAEADLQRALGLASATPGSGDATIVHLRNLTADVQRKAGRLDDAKATVDDALRRGQVLEPTHVANTEALQVLSRVELARGNVHEAVRTARLALDRVLTVSDRWGSTELKAQLDLGRALAASGALADAEAQFLEGLALERTRTQVAPVLRIAFLNELIKMLKQMPDRAADVERFRTERSKAQAVLAPPAATPSQ